jgi:hypothetical protein
VTVRPANDSGTLSKAGKKNIFFCGVSYLFSHSTPSRMRVFFSLLFMGEGPSAKFKHLKQNKKQRT